MNSNERELAHKRKKNTIPITLLQSANDYHQSLQHTLLMTQTKTRLILTNDDHTVNQSINQ
jgi:hypothetical protein